MEYLGCVVENARLEDLACPVDFRVLSDTLLGKQGEGESFGV